MYNINTIADFVIFRLTAEDDHGLINLKLQKLLYYIQAWHLAFNDRPLFNGKFQAWIHGPVNREVYDRFKDTKYLYTTITSADIIDEASIEKIDEASKMHIENILEGYAKFSGAELEVMTHREDPWVITREGYSPTQRCEKEIDEQLMASFYRSRLS